MPQPEPISLPIPEPWWTFLRELDALLREPVVLHCIGGFVVTVFYGLPRTTSDIDFLEIAPRKAGQAMIGAGQKDGELHRRHGVYLDQVTVAQPPEDYESRLVEMAAPGLQRLRLMALDPYDIALTKLERNAARDRDDVQFLARTIPFDLALFQKRYTAELRPYLSRPEREDLTMQLWIEIMEEDRARGFAP